MDSEKIKSNLNQKGYSVLNTFYSEIEINELINCIDTYEAEQKLDSSSGAIFAIRQVLKAIPELKPKLFSPKFVEFISSLFSSKPFLTKAIYFDKPSDSNWFVAYHQDLSITVNQKSDIETYTNWTFKKGQYGVLPPVQILENSLTIRIHLDDTDEENGALRVVPKSHLKGIIKPKTKAWNTENEEVCKVSKGGIMLMKPLLLHASSRTANNKRRRVIHLEFNTQELAKPLLWAEREDLLAQVNSLKDLI